MTRLSRRFIIVSFVLGLAWTQVAGAQTTTVTFDTPPPPGGSALNGVFQSIDFGTGQWQWIGAYNVNPTNHIYFADSSGTSRSFRFAPAPRVLNSLRVYSPRAGTLTLSDDTGQTLTYGVTTGSLQLVTTGWSRPATTVTVSFTEGWALGVDDITYSTAAPTAPSTAVDFDNPPPPGPLNGVFQSIDFGTWQWQWTGAHDVNSTNHIYFSNSTGTSRSFRFSEGPRVLNSVRVYSVTPGTLTLSDDAGQKLTSEVTTGSLRLVSTGWTRPATTVTVSFTEGWDLGVDDIASSPASAGAVSGPTLSSLSPSSALAGGPAFTLTVTGTNFVTSSAVRWNGAARPTTFVSSTRLSAAIAEADIATPGTAQVRVFTPDEQSSNALPFTISNAPNPVPALSGLSPSAVAAGNPAFTLTVTGSGFVAASVVLWNGGARPTTVVSSTRLQAAISASDVAFPGTASVTVFTPAPGGGRSLAQTFTAASARGAGSALRFFGTGSGDVDRVKIPLENRPVNIGATDTTIEWWMRANPGDNPPDACRPGEDNWILGGIIFDRDIIGPGDFGDWGISLRGGRLAFGVDNGTVGVGICGATDLADGVWHHVAVTRRVADGRVQIFVDGQFDGGGIGPAGDIAYRSGRSTSFPNYEPFLVIGAEKYDAGDQYPSFRGWIDEVRLSTIIRYTGNFVRPSQPFTPDPQTAALYHFDEGAGDQITDSSGAAAGPSEGIRRFGGVPSGPEWVVSDAPLQ
jgi:concanavalin A-like lectin/glucanase superfamily protein/IPT/TIG domain-containing protein